MPRDDHFAEALNEVLEGRMDTGLFARSFALERRDEPRTKAKYIELRAAALEAEEKARVNAAEHAEHLRQKQLKERQLKELQAREAERQRQKVIQEQIREQQIKESRVREKERLLEESRLREVARSREEARLSEEARLRHKSFQPLAEDPELADYQQFCREYGKVPFSMVKRRKLFGRWLLDRDARCKPPTAEFDPCPPLSADDETEAGDDFEADDDVAFEEFRQEYSCHSNVALEIFSQDQRMEMFRRWLEARSQSPSE